MNGILKQRLLGALVLIALGVIFWPVVFVEPGQNGLDRSTQVPPMPDFPEREIASPQPLQGLEGPGPVEEVLMHDEPPQAIDTPVELQPEPEAEPEADVEEEKPVRPVEKPTRPVEKPALDERGIPIAWVVQVATVSERSRAEALQRQLIDLDYKANVKTISRDGRQLHKVYIGPKFDKAQAQAIKQQVDRRFRVKSIVSRYLP